MLLGLFKLQHILQNFEKEQLDQINIGGYQMHNQKWTNQIDFENHGNNLNKFKMKFIMQND